MTGKHIRPKPKRAKNNISLPAALCLLLAFGMLLFARCGGEDTVRDWMATLAGDETFVSRTLALEYGAYPDSSGVYAPSGAAAGEEEDENTPSPLVSESAYLPELGGALPEGVVGTVKINNDTGFSYDIEEMLKNPVTIKAKGDGPQVMIVHTHSTESYTSDSENAYTPTESERTTDAKYNVIRIGDEIAKVLEKQGIATVHCRKIFDQPAFSGSYGRSLDAVEEQLEKTPSIQIVIDVHRDSVTKDDGSVYRTSCTIDGEEMAQLMFVVGTNGSGLSHDDWRENLNFMVNLQSAVQGAYPGLMRPLNLRKQRFNQQVRVGAMLVEVGSSGNTLSEAIAAAQRFARVLAKQLT